MVTDTSKWVGATLCEGRYQVHRKLGEGGMAHVYLARDEKLERDVVIKVPRSNLIHDPTFAGRFTREVRSLARLAHPHIVPLIDIGQHDGIPFAVMSYLTGGSLRDRQPRGPNGEAMPMPTPTLGVWLPAAAQALDFVHKSKFIHRDIKPENILFDEDGQAFLSDLGIIKALAEPAADPNKRTVFTGAGMVLGTPQYMAPELILGEAVDGRVDQYALAVTLYEVIAGQVPFSGSSAPAIFIQQTTKPPRDLQEIVPDISDALARAVARALAKSPAERFKTCYEFAQAALVGQSVKFYTPSGGTPATVVEQSVPKTPVVTATLLEPSPLGTRTPVETPSDLSTSTRPNTPSPKWKRAPTPVPGVNPPKRRSRGKSRTPLFLVVGAVLSVAAASLAYFFQPRAEAALAVSAPTKFTIAAGEKKTLKIDLHRKNVDGEIQCSLEGLPDGVTAEPMVIPAGKTTGTFDVAAAASALPKTIAATVKAKCKDTESSAPVEVAVAASAIAPSWEFLPVKKPIILRTSETATAELSVERRNCSGEITLEIEGLPPGVIWVRQALHGNVIKEEESTYQLRLRADETAGASAAAVGKSASHDIPLTVRGELNGIVNKTSALLTIIPKKIETPPSVTPDTPTPSKQRDILISKINDITMKAGTRRTVFLKVERKNGAGPVKLLLTAVPPPGVGIEPKVLPVLNDGQDSVSFDIVADSTAQNSFMDVRVAATFGTVSRSTSFRVDLRRDSTIEDLIRSTPIKQDKPVSPPPPPPQANQIVKLGKLTKESPFDTVRSASRANAFPVFLKAGQGYAIEMTSKTLDSFLRIEDSNGAALASDDNSGGGANARIIFTPRTSAIHYLIGTSTVGGQLGDFTISVTPR